MGVNTFQEKLVERYNLSISCLDYTYIGKCSNLIEIENILRVLRSGQEGVYPDLVKFCENRLKELCPNNKLLLVQKPIAYTKDLPLHEQEFIQEDMKTWQKQMQQCSDEQVLSKCKENDVPIRKAAEIQHNDEDKEDCDKSKKSTNAFRHHCKKPRSFSDWAKFDVEEEVEKVENDAKVLEQKVSEKKTSCELKPYLDTTALSAAQKLVIAERERMKGNEAFKAGDFDEAGLYYSRSISASITVAALNNRAFTNFKLKNFTAALMDCNMVLDMEADNIKALYRRGLVYKETNRPQLAYMDFSTALDLDPDNKAAKEQLNTIEKSPHSAPSEKESVVIEEIMDGDDKNKAIDEVVQSPETTAIRCSSPKKKQSLSTPNKGKSALTMLSPKTMDLLNICGKGFPVKETTAANADEPLLTICEQHSIRKSAASKEPNVDHMIFEEKEEFMIEVKPLCKGEPSSKIHDIDNNIEKSGIHKIGFTDTTPNVLKTEIKEDSFTEKIHASPEEYKMRENPDQKDNIPCNPLFEPMEITDITTPFRFMSLWHSMKANDDPETGAVILRNLHPAKLPTMLSNKLDGDLLLAIIRAIALITSTELERGYELMKFLFKTSRIHTVSTFLSHGEKNEIRDLCLTFKESGMDNDQLLDTVSFLAT